MTHDGRGELVFVCGRDPYRHTGGSESFNRGAVSTANELGLHPHVFAMAPRSEVHELPGATLHLVASPVRLARTSTAVLHAPWLRRSLVRFLAERPGPHVVHGFGVWADCGRAACAELERRGVEAIPIATAWMAIESEAEAKLASEIVQRSRRLRLGHGAEYAWQRAVTRRLEHRAYNASRVVLVNYESVRTLLVDAYGPAVRIRRTTYAAATAFEAPPADAACAAVAGELSRLGAPDAPLIVTTSRHDGRKGLDVLIRALAALRDGGVAFRACLTGTGVLLPGHRALICELGLADRIALPGRVEHVMPYLRAAEVFVLPSVMEGSGSVSVLEALQAGVAVVSTNVDGMPEDLTDGEDALLVAPGDPAALAGALARLIGDEALRRRLAAAARATYERRFSAAVAAADLGAVYAELGLMGPHRSAAPPRRRG